MEKANFNNNSLERQWKARGGGAWPAGCGKAECLGDTVYGRGVSGADCSGRGYRGLGHVCGAGARPRVWWREGTGGARVLAGAGEESSEYTAIVKL